VYPPRPKLPDGFVDSGSGRALVPIHKHALRSLVPVVPLSFARKLTDTLMSVASDGMLKSSYEKATQPPEAFTGEVM
jgi:hypothetical protein